MVELSIHPISSVPIFELELEVIRKSGFVTLSWPAVGLPVCRVEVLDDLSQVVRHALQLRVERLGQLVGALPLRVWRRRRRQR